MGVRFVALIALAVAVTACDQDRKLPDDGYIDVPGGRVAFRIIGDGTSTPALWIHGGPGGSSCGAVDNLPAVSNERPVILYDQLGSGYSDRITDLETHANLPRFVKEVVAIREELGLDELHLIGQSWGNAVALEYLLTASPSGIKSVVFVSPFFGTEQWIADGHVLLDQMPSEDQAIVASAAESGNFDSDEFAAVNEEYWYRFGIRTPRDQLNLTACDKKPSGDSGLYQFMWGAAEFVSTGVLRDYSRIDRLSELDLPVLFITGEYDQARPDTVRYFQSLVEGSEMAVMPNSGHIVYLDQTELFNTTLVDFLGRADAPR